MSLTQINDYGVGNVNLTSMMETLDRQRRGYQAISLTHYDDNLECKIAAGSIIEVGGALFKTEALESITGWGGIGNSNDVYVKIVPAGAVATAVFVTAAPTWSTSKQGWYAGNDRYVGGLYKDSGGAYVIKWLYAPEDVQNLLREGQTRPLLEKVYVIGNWDMTGPVNVDVAVDAFMYPKLRHVSAIIRGDVEASASYPLDRFDGTEMAGGVDSITSTIIRLYRETGGPFDSAGFNNPAYNRGWVYIKYRA